MRNEVRPPPACRKLRGDNDERRAKETSFFRFSPLFLYPFEHRYSGKTRTFASFARYYHVASGSFLAFSSITALSGLRDLQLRGKLIFNP
ncbi:hypothetical protein WN51_05184 [Melipona quadrifasciata]|uniref:Uncharacterized protein n=1 Tax=Melipona quadrifasciata TaxID=166423 RepID=A0A0M8ZU97_9HYME|nr:hypothetical protein WN51_05184 [Melipona quadrifasciata]